MNGLSFQNQINSNCATCGSNCNWRWKKYHHSPSKFLGQSKPLQQLMVLPLPAHDFYSFLIVLNLTKNVYYEITSDKSLSEPTGHVGNTRESSVICVSQLKIAGYS